MELRRGKIVPVVGGVTAAAAAVGAFAPAAQVAVAAPDVATGAAAPLGVAQEGVFESCEAYFGNGKGMVGFDVADVNGSDGVAHAVPVDVDVVLVLENEAGDTIECVPEEWTEEDWEEWVNEVFETGGPALPASPTRYRYPATDDVYIERDEFGDVVSAAFRVVDVPGQHTLVSPTGLKPLEDPYPAEEDFFDAVAHPTVLALITDAAGPDAADAFAAAMADCDSEAPLSEELSAAFEVIVSFLGWSDEELNQCDAWWMDVDAAFGLAMVEAASYVEPIRLSLPTAPTSPAPPASPPAAQPAVVTPSYTG